MPLCPWFQIGGWDGDSDTGARAKLEVRSEDAPKRSHGGVVDRKRWSIVQVRDGVALTSAKRFVHLTLTEVIKDLDEAEACREAEKEGGLPA